MKTKFGFLILLSLAMIIVALTTVAQPNVNEASTATPAINEQYLKTHRGNFQAEFVIQHILYNSTFPHSVSYCLGQLSRYFERLEPDSLPESYRHLEFLVGKTLTTVRYSDTKAGDGAGLRAFLQQVRQQLLEIAAALNQYYFGNS